MQSVRVERDELPCGKNDVISVLFTPTFVWCNLRLSPLRPSLWNSSLCRRFLQRPGFFFQMHKILFSSGRKRRFWDLRNVVRYLLKDLRGLGAKKGSSRIHKCFRADYCCSSMQLTSLQPIEVQHAITLYLKWSL